MPRVFFARNAGAAVGDCRPAGQAGTRTRGDSRGDGAAADFAGRMLQHPISRYDSDSREGRAEALIGLARKRP